ncbi:MAG TPA: FAD-binding oxidoreductase [Acidimicrobiia bacterium]|nr:FAD-binding oxidoreductase [Acidimicrobiia bacterium]
MTSTVDVPEKSVERFRAALSGEILQSGDHRYEEHRRIWNGSINRHPGLIVRCEGVPDVCTAVRFAREHDLLTAVRGGGHSFPGHSTCDGGIVIDMGPMSGIRVDPDALIAHAGAGVLLGDLDRETQRFGLAVPAGVVSHTGIAGLTLGGGTGWQQRKYGLSIDNLLSVDLVTAEGDQVTASKEENADLFFGVRGGGGNFGIATSFTFRTNPIGPQVMAGPVFWSMEDTPTVLRFYRDWIADCPDELTTIVFQRKLPDFATVPRDLVGKRVVGVVACYAGPVEAGEDVLSPLKAFGLPVLDLCEPKPFVVHQTMFDQSYPHGCWYYVRSCDVVELSDEVIDIVVGHGNQINSPMSSLALWQMGGAVARVGENETAFHGRNAGFTFNINGNTESADGFEAEREWARSYWSALEPYHTSVYVNFLMDEGEDRIRAAYGSGKYDRLKTLKRRYDPTNLFRLNQNITPD